MLRVKSPVSKKYIGIIYPKTKSSTFLYNSIESGDKLSIPRIDPYIPYEHVNNPTPVRVEEAMLLECTKRKDGLFSSDSFTIENPPHHVLTQMNASEWAYNIIHIDEIIKEDGENIDLQDKSQGPEYDDPTDLVVKTDDNDPSTG